MARIKAQAPLGGGVSGHFDPKGFEDMEKNLHRPFNACADAFYAESRDEEFEYQTNIIKESKGIGCGRAQAQLSVVEVRIRGPNAKAGVRVGPQSVQAFAGAEAYGASAAVGPVKVRYGLGANIGGRIGRDGVEAKAMGYGVAVGRKMAVCVAGFGLEVELWEKKK